MTLFETIMSFLAIATPFSLAFAWSVRCLFKQFEKIDARFEKIDARFERMEAKIDGLEEKFESRFDRLEAKIDAVQVDVKKLNIRVAHIEGAYFGKDLPKHVVIGEE